MAAQMPFSSCCCSEGATRSAETTCPLHNKVKPKTAKARNLMVGTPFLDPGRFAYFAAEATEITTQLLPVGKRRASPALPPSSYTSTCPRWSVILLPCGRMDGRSAHGLANGATRTIVPSQPEAVGDAKTT